MSSKKVVQKGPKPDFTKVAKEVLEIQMEKELEQNFLSYAYMVNESRALPDVRDGLKPVQRRILFNMYSNGLTPDKKVRKSATTVGDTMGKLHPHGDSSIYEAMVNMALWFKNGLPMLDPKGNWGDRPGASAAASRYTECRLAEGAMWMVQDLKEKPVDYVPNYDEELMQPSVLPAAFPQLIVNGVSGIAVGFATEMPLHNPVEVLNAAHYLVLHPNASLDKVMEFVPGPDFPTGGDIIGLDGIRDAYETGRGRFIIRAHSEIRPLGRGRNSVVFTSYPHNVDLEKVITQIKEGLAKDRFVGVTDVRDLSEKSGTEFVVEVKAGVNPEVIREALYKYTSFETPFSVNATVLGVDKRPRLMGLLEQFHEWIDFRKVTVLRRTQQRLDKAKARLHIVEGLLKALANIDVVIKIIRASESAAVAKEGLIQKFKLDDTQAEYILSIPLRRLTKFDQIELNAERDDLKAQVVGFNEIISDDDVLRKLIAKELDQMRKSLDVPRVCNIVGVSLDEHKSQVVQAAKQANVEIEDGPCFLYLNHKGGIVRSEGEKKGSWLGVIPANTRGRFIVVTSKGVGHRVDVLHVGDRVSSVSGLVNLARGEKVVAITPVELPDGVVGGLALGTKKGVVKIASPQWPQRSDEFSVIGLDADDEVVGAAWVQDTSKHEFAFLSSDTSLLVFSADKVRPQGLSGGGMAGIKLSADQHVVAFGVIPQGEAAQAMAVTISDKMNGKQTPLSEYPRKGRATGGVRSQTLLRGESGLVAGALGVNPVVLTVDGKEMLLPPVNMKRDASGKPVDNGQLAV